MPSNKAVKTTLIDFTNNVKIFIEPQIDDRPLDQYLASRDKVYLLIESPDDLGNALLIEIKAVSVVIEVEKATETSPENDRKKWYEKWLLQLLAALRI